MKNFEELLTIKDVCEILNQKKSWVNHQIFIGKIPSVKLCGTVRIKRKDVLELIERGYRAKKGEAK